MYCITPDNLYTIGFRAIDADKNCFKRGRQLLKFKQQPIKGLHPAIISKAYMEYISSYHLPNYSLDKLADEIQLNNGPKKLTTLLELGWRRLVLPYLIG